MVDFNIKQNRINWDNVLRISENNQDYIVVDTSQLQVRVQIDAELFQQDNSYFIGYVQVVRWNNHHLYYGNHVDQRWEFSKIPLSDSPSKAERPWYGLDRDDRIGGYRRQYLPKPGEPGGGPPFDLEMWMSDDLQMQIAKFETLACSLGFTAISGSRSG